MKIVEERERLKLIKIENGNDWEEIITYYKSIEKPIDVYTNTIKYLQENYRVNSILIEEEYIDQDYRNEFSNFYSKAFKKHDSLCKRINFFQKFIASIEEIKNTDLDKLGYLGFISLRPLPISHVSRTILNPFIEKDIDYPLCTAKFKAHILGNEFIIEGSPFIQQDRMVMCCAHASLWMVCKYMNVKYGFPPYLPYEINEKMSKDLSIFGRTIPAEKGVSVESIYKALGDMGYYPLVFDKAFYTDEIKIKWSPISYIYKYIESRVPVIVGITGHVFVIVGHTFNYSPKFEKERKKITFEGSLQKAIERKGDEDLSIINNEKWIDGLIVNDDSQGPYRILPTTKENAMFFENNKKKKNILLRNEGEIIIAEKDIDYIIVPLLEKIYLRGEYVDEIVKGLIQNKEFKSPVYVQAKNGNKYSEEFLLCLKDNNNPIVLRSYFLSSQEFKKSLLIQYKEKNEDIFGNLNKEVLGKYLEMEMSHYIWLTEITSKNRISKKEEKERTILGEIILDTTANRYTYSFLSIHFPGVLIIREPNQKSDSLYQENIKIIPINDDGPYSQYRRVDL